MLSAGIISTALATQEAGDVFTQAKDIANKTKAAVTEGQVAEAAGSPRQIKEGDLPKILAALKNPFTSQLPQPEKTAVDETTVFSNRPEPEPVDIPQMIPRDEPIPKPQFEVNGLVWNTDRPQAIINSNVVEVGDYVGQWEITEIKKEGIAIRFRTQEYLIEPK